MSLSRIEEVECLYRCIDFECLDEDGLMPEAFMDNYPDQSFFVSPPARPDKALSAIAKRVGVRRRCDTGKQFPSPRKMFEVGYRVASIPAKLLIEKMALTATSQYPLAIATVPEGDFKPDGHIGLINAKMYPDWFCLHSIVLTRDEIFAVESSLFKSV